MVDRLLIGDFRFSILCNLARVWAAPSLERINDQPSSINNPSTINNRPFNNDVQVSANGTAIAVVEQIDPRIA
jgi:hypothetical protein